MIKNHADSLIYQSEKLLAESGDKISDEDKSAIGSGIENLKLALEGEDLSALKAAIETLNQALHKASSAMYQDAGNQQESHAQQNDSEADVKEDENVVDAEFEEVGA